METHTAIIERLGGLRKVASALGHTNHTTVQGWSERNNIPMTHWTELVQAAERLGKPLSVRDLMPPELREASEAA